MSKIKDSVKADVRRYFKAYRFSDEYWEDNIEFVNYLRLPKAKCFTEDLFNTLFTERIYKREDKITELEILLANVFNSKRKAVAISLNRNDWKETRYNKISYFIIEIIKRMEQAELIRVKKGYNFRKDGKSRMTRIAATDKLLESCPLVHRDIGYEAGELIEKRDEKGNLLNYADTEETHRIRRILERANAVNAKAEIQHGKQRLKTFLTAIFKEKFTLYGRLHTRGIRHYQGLSGEERAELTINGQAVIELDYSALHPNLLYAMEGIQYLGDPYLAVTTESAARPFLKQILLCMLNGKDELQAERAANKWLRDNWSEKQRLAKIGITKARPLMEDFAKAHQPISHYFCTGKETGLRIMNKDSKIALDVINHFAKQNIPILAVHDSFIVQRQHATELRLTMKNIYAKHTNGKRIKVK